MADRPWKRCERAIARRLNGRRTGPSGCRGPDVLAGWLQIEVKCRKRLPRWLLDALQQAGAGCLERCLPIVILHEAATRHDHDLVILSLADFQEWFGDLPTGDVAETALEQDGAS